MSYVVVDGGSLSSPTASGTSLGSVYAPSLTTSATGYWFDASGSIAISTSTGTNEQWAPSPASVSATSANTLVVSMYNQYKVTASYSTSDGSTPSASVILSGTQFGSSGYTLTLTKLAQTTWLDATTGWSVNNPVASGSQRWDAASGTSGTVSGATTVAPSYYHQYQVTPYFTVSDSSSPTVTNVVSCTSFGGSVSVTPVKGSSGGSAVWVDAGSAVKYTSPIAGSGERWQVSSSDGGTYTALSPVSSSAAVTVEYYDQYSFQLAYSVSGGGSGYSSPALTASQFGSSYTPTLTSSSSTYWLDSGSSWSIPNPLVGSGSTERWYSIQTTSGIVSASSPTTAGGSLTFTYNNQYAISFAVSPSGEGSTTPSGTNWYNSGILSISASANAGYTFSSWSTSGSITIASSTSASTTATVNGAGTITATFTQITYQVSFATSGGGSGSTTSPSGTQTYAAGQQVTITANPDTGYSFLSWSASSGSISFGNANLASTTATVNGAGTITATFTQITYQVSFATSGGGSGSTTSPSGTQTYAAGQQVTITANPDTGYSFLSWSASSGSISFGNANLASTTATVNGAGTITATFTQITYQVSFATSGGGSGSTTSPSGTQTYAAGQQVTITANPDTGYSFLSWSASSGSISFGNANLASTTATVNGAGTITATFTQITYQVSFATSGGGSGSTTSPSGTQTYAAGQQVTITANPDTGYSFLSWSASSGSISFGNANLASTTATVNGAGTITATFTQITYQVSFATSGGGSGSTTSPSGTQTYAAGQQVTITANPDTGYSFLSWSASSGSISFGNANLASTTATVNGAGTITATFNQSGFQVNFVLGSGGQSMTPVAGENSYSAGSIVQISATADGTHGFCQWTATGSITFDSATSASAKATINGAGTITATFSPFAIDVSNSTSTTIGNTMIINLATTQPNELLYLSWVGNSAQTIASISSTGTSAWAMRAQVSADNNVNHLLETWYAISSAAGTYTITITMNDTNGDCAAMLFGISGANTTSPFDGNASSQTGPTATTVAQSVSITTTNANDLVIATLGVQNGNPTGVTVNNLPTFIKLGSETDTSPSRYVAAAYYLATTTGTFKPDFAWQNPGSWGMILDAIEKG